MRSLKALALALFAVLAMGALFASAASAQEGEIFETDGAYPMHLFGEDVEPTHAEITNGTLTPALTGQFPVTCTDSTYTANVEEESAELTVEPDYQGCWVDAAHETTPVTVTMNGCDYRFHHLTTKSEQDPDNWSVTVDLKCPENKLVEIHRYSSPANHAAGSSNCTITIGENGNQNLAGLTVYEETGGIHALRLEDTVPVTGETHGVCSFGFTVDIKTTLDVNATIEGTEADEDVGITD